MGDVTVTAPAWVVIPLLALWAVATFLNWRVVVWQKRLTRAKEGVGGRA